MLRNLSLWPCRLATARRNVGNRRIASRLTVALACLSLSLLTPIASWAQTQPVSSAPHIVAPATSSASGAPPAAQQPAQPSPNYPPAPPGGSSGAPAGQMHLGADAMPTEWFTMADAYAAMNRSNPVLLALIENDHAAEADVIAAGLWTNPSLSVSYTNGINGPSYTYDAVGNGQFVFQQLIELSNLPGARRHVAEAVLDATRNDSEGIRRTLFFDLQTAILAMAVAETRREILHDTVAHLVHAQNIVAIRVNAGAAPRYDLARIDIALANVRADEGDAIADLAAARGQLDFVVGEATRSLHGLPRYDVYESPALPSLATLLDTATRLRPDLRAAAARARAARGAIDIARRTVFQGIGAYAGAAFGAGNRPSQADPTYHGVEVDFVVGVTVPLPFVDRGQGTIPAAERRARAADFASRALLIQTQLRIEALYREVMQRRENLASYDETSGAEAEEMLRMAEAQYREGRTQILDLVDAYASVRDSRLRRLSLASDARTAELDLARGVGSMGH